jgi:hypothetical protein
MDLTNTKESKKLAGNADNAHQDIDQVRIEMNASSSSLHVDAQKCTSRDLGTVKAAQMDGSHLQIRVSVSQLLSVLAITNISVVLKIVINAAHAHQDG